MNPYNLTLCSLMIIKALAVMWITSNMKQSSNTLLFLQKETHTTQHSYCMKVDPYLMKHMDSNMLYRFNFKFIPSMCYIKKKIFFFKKTWNETRLFKCDVATLHRLDKSEIKISYITIKWNETIVQSTMRALKDHRVCHKTFLTFQVIWYLKNKFINAYE